MDELPDIIWTIAIVGGILSGVIGSGFGLIQRYIKYYREQKTKILTEDSSEPKVEDIQSFIYKWVIYKSIIRGKEKKKKAGIPVTTFKDTSLAINNPTVQRWSDVSRYSGDEEYKESLRRHLDWLSNVTIAEIMSNDYYREGLLKALKSANQNNRAV